MVDDAATGLTPKPIDDDGAESMTATHFSWLEAGQGLIQPKLDWSFLTRAQLSCLRYTAESREIYAADISGVLYLMNQHGEVVHHIRDIKKVTHLEWSANGELGLICQRGHVVRLLNRNFESEWEAKFREDVRTISIAHQADYLAVALSNSDTILYDRFKRKISRIKTVKELDELHFAWEHKTIIGSSDVGLLCSFGLNGKLSWSKSPFREARQIGINSNATRIYVTVPGQGIQVFDDEGEKLGTYQLKGTPLLLSISPLGNRLAVVTSERYLLWMNSEGTILWATRTNEHIASICCDGLGNQLLIGFEKGEICALSFEE
ncbi:MAG: hypothetical protein R3C11_05890 [Planctomycetaceae bacterium]